VKCIVELAFQEAASLTVDFSRCRRVVIEMWLWVIRTKSLPYFLCWFITASDLRVRRHWWTSQSEENFAEIGPGNARSGEVTIASKMYATFSY